MELLSHVLIMCVDEIMEGERVGGGGGGGIVAVSELGIITLGTCKRAGVM